MRGTAAIALSPRFIVHRVQTRVSSPIFVGRREELERLKEALVRAREGTASAYLITGDAGVGKTRFVEEVAALAGALGWRVLSGGCVRLEGGALPFQPFIEAFREAQSGPKEPLSGEALSEFGRLMLQSPSPEVTEGPGAGPGRAALSQLFELTLGLMRRLSTERPLLLVVEDIHWADRSTLDLLAFLTRNLRQEAVVLLVTCRTDELPRRHPMLSYMAELSRASHAHRFELKPLAREEQLEQLRAIAGPELEPEQVERIWIRSEGNPFFAEELLASGAGPDLPDTLRDLLLARIAMLTDGSQAIVRLASVAGRQVSPELLGQASELDLEAAEAGLREAVANRILVIETEGALEVVAFRHALLREAVYGDILPAARRRLHAAVARKLENLPDVASDALLSSQIAHHWYAAREMRKALAAIVAAARSAELVSALPDALAHYERALEIWDRVSDPEVLAGCDRAELLASAGRVARPIDPAKAVECIRSAIELVDERSDPVRASLLFRRLSEYAWETLDHELGLESSAKALRLIPPEPPSVARAAALTDHGSSLRFAGRNKESIEVLQEAIAMSRELGARDIEGQALCSTAGVMTAHGAAAAMCRRAREIGYAVGDHDLVSRASIILASALCDEDPDQAMSVALEGFEHAKAHGFAMSRGGTLLCVAGYVMVAKGRWDEAQALAERTDGMTFTGLGEPDLAMVIAELEMGRGRFEEAARRLSSIRRAVAQLADPDRQVCFFGLMAALALGRGEPDNARVAAAQAFRIPLSDLTADYVGIVCVSALRAEADLAAIARGRRGRGNVGECVAHGEEILRRAKTLERENREGPPTQARLSRAHLAQCEAEWARLVESGSYELWTKTAAQWRECNVPYRLAYALFREAEAMLAAGSGRPRAAASLTEAYEIASRLGAAPLSGKIEELARRSRIDLMRSTGGKSAASKSANFGLSDRELEVLALLLEGRTNREIGATLFVSERTASAHVNHICNKLGVNSRGAAAAVAARMHVAETTSNDSMKATPDRT
jgi:DNA-binding CsgD family transcriptional regulator/tetratricopeptide (TPR) repeat protein